MKRILAALSLALALVAAPSHAKDTSSTNLTLHRTLSSAALSKAKKHISLLQSKRVSKRQMNVYLQKATALRGTFRRSPPSDDATWASLIAPVNFCTDLVRKVCGETEQCGAQQTCEIALHMLDEYNSAPSADDQHEMEGMCVITLQDNVVFPACE